MEKIKNNLCGIGLCVLIAGIATFLGGLNIGSFSFEIIGAPVFAILIGMLISLVSPGFSGHRLLKDGIRFSSKKVLQWAVIILGFSMNLSTVVEVGGKSLPVILSTISISLVLSYVLMKVMKIKGNIACLIGVGSSICGGSAIAATAPVIEADDEDVAQSVSVIFLFNVLAALIFPSLGHMIGLGSEGFAVFAGTAVNDTSSVTAAASTAEGIYGISGILSSAVIVKLTRTLAIIPITLALAFYRTHKAKRSGTESGGYSIKKIFPFFILFFIAASLVTTIMGIIPESGFTAFYSDSFVPASKWLAKFFIAIAMCGIGLNTNIVKLIKNGKKPIVLGLCCWIAITLTSIGVQLLTGIYYTDL